MRIRTTIKTKEDEMKNTVTMEFTVEELGTICDNMHAYACHLRLQAIKNGNPHQFDKSIKRANDISGRAYYAMIKARREENA